MKSALERFGFSTEGMPEWQDIVDLITPSMLVPAYKMVRPALLLVPPCTMKEMVKSIDKHRLPCQYKTSYPGWLDGYIDFFDTYWEKRPHGWGIGITEGEADAAGTTDSANNLKRFENWKKWLEKRGFELMDDARAYLTLWMLRAHEGVTVDRHPVALLMSHGDHDILTVSWFDRGIAIKPSLPRDNWPALHARGMIWIRKPW